MVMCVDSRLRGNLHGHVKATQGDENALAPGTGNHKGCLYDGFAGAYFQRNDGKRVGSETVSTR